MALAPEIVLASKPSGGASTVSRSIRCGWAAGGLLALLHVPPVWALAGPYPAPPRVVFATYAEGAAQARKAAVLVDSLRRFGGALAEAPFFAVADADGRAELAKAGLAGTTVLPLEAAAVARGVPFAAKAYAAAAAERLVEGAETLAWMDPESLVVAPPRALDLGPGAAVALRPVFLVNAVGLAEEAPVDGYWARLFREAGVDPASVPAVESFADEKRIRFYVNCGVIAWRPGRGIAREWVRVLAAVLADEAWSKEHVTEPRHLVFLHQAVVSAVILSRTSAAERRWLPPDHGYPLNLHDRLPAAKRARRLEDLACFIYDTLWDRDPDWLARAPVGEPLRGWLEDADRRARGAGYNARPR
jgi:hypothetical protein